MCVFFSMVPQFPNTYSKHLKMDGWNTHFFLGRVYFQGLCLFPGGTNSLKRETAFPRCIFFNQLFIFGGVRSCSFLD